MKKALLLICLMAMIAHGTLIPAQAQEEPIVLSLPDNLPEDTEGTLSIAGEQTAGVTFAVHGIYYDGYLLEVSVVQIPNEENVSLMENDVVQPDYLTQIEKDTAQQFGETVLGTYCSFKLKDETGKEIDQEYRITSQRNGSDLNQTYHFYFLPNHAPKEVKIELTFGIDETVNSTFDFLDNMYLNIPIQETADIHVVPIDSNKDSQGLQEVFIAQTETRTSIYAFFRDDGSERAAKFNVVAAKETYVPFSQIGYDSQRSLGYYYCVLETASKEGSFHLFDQKNLANYDINPLDGTAELLNF